MNTLNIEAKLADKYKYKPLPKDLSEKYRQFYIDNLPKGFKLEGSDSPLYILDGNLICNGYRRIVVGDYGAFIEFDKEQANEEIFEIAPGQEYRVNDPKYSKNVKYVWMTISNSDIKIYKQKKKVAYADYKSGMYYISPHEDLVIGYVLNNEQCEGQIQISFDKIPNHCGECELYLENVYYDESAGWGDGYFHRCPFRCSIWRSLVERPKDCPIKVKR